MLVCREAGIGCSVSPGTTAAIDSHRTEIIKLLITCFSETLYYKPEGTYEGRVWGHWLLSWGIHDAEIGAPNRWMLHFTSSENRLASCKAACTLSITIASCTSSSSSPSHLPFSLHTLPSSLLPISLLLPPFFPFLHFPHPHPSTSSFVPSLPFPLPSSMSLFPILSLLSFLSDMFSQS